LEQRKSGVITVTDRRMTRFWLTLSQGTRFVTRCLERMQGGEVFVPKIPSMQLLELAEAIAPGCAIREIGIRPGEKLHEVLISEDEARHAREFEDMYIVQPAHWFHGSVSPWLSGRPVEDGFRYASDTNIQWLSAGELLHLADIPHEPDTADTLSVQ
jgi:UDP-N-acetylglucosamine 4,6-dehydratase